MPKARSNKDDHLAQWYGPAASWSVTNSLFTQKPAEISFTTTLKDQYRLDLPTEQRRLFNEYRRIKTPEDCLDWAMQNGPPAYVPESPASTQQVSESTTSMIAAAAFLRQLTSLKSALQGLVEDPNNAQHIEVLKGLVEETPLLDKHVQISFRDLTDAPFSDGRQMQSRPLPQRIFMESQWKRDKRNPTVELAKAVLVEAGNVLVIALQPRLGFADNSHWRLAHEFTSRCPWEAISTHMVRLLTGTEVLADTCPHPKCGKSLEDKRAGATNCGSWKCQKYVARQNKKADAE